MVDDGSIGQSEVREYLRAYLAIALAKGFTFWYDFEGDHYEATALEFSKIHGPATLQIKVWVQERGDDSVMLRLLADDSGVPAWPPVIAELMIYRDRVGEDGKGMGQSVIGEEARAFFEEHYFEYLRELLFSYEFDTLRLIKENDARVLNISDQYGNTLLESAIDEKNLKAIDFLLRIGADPDWKHIGTPILVSVIQDGNLKIAEMLLDYGADPNLIDECNGWTPLDWTHQCGNEDMVEIIRKSGGVRSEDAE